MIATAAIEFQLGNRESFKQAHLPSIMADAAHVIMDSSARQITGRLLIDEEILRESGVTEMGHYRFEPDSNATMMLDLLLTDITIQQMKVFCPIP